MSVSAIRLKITGLAQCAANSLPDRKGTMVHPDYQKKGFGTFLTRHCNAISDKTGGRTFAPARPTSQKMFENEGYKILGFYDSHFERWGDQYLSVSKTAAMVRDAPS